MTDVAKDVRRHAIAGVRGSIALSVATLPLSFLTNLMLGRVSPEALGYYSAVQIFLGTYFTFLVFGGVFVFTRLVPTLDRRDAASFLATYLGIVAVGSVLAGALLTGFAPALASRLIAGVGNPPPVLAIVVLASGLLWGFASYFLFSVLAGAKASAVDKTAVVGFFVAAALGFGPLRSALAADPSKYLWASGAVVYTVGGLLGFLLIRGTAEWRERGRWRVLLPARFWPTVAYTHVDTVVNYLYLTLSPAIVLLWIDVGSLGRLHAALRYVMLLALVPGTISQVLAPALSTLDISGLREAAFRQAAAAMRASSLAVVPATILAVLFADDAMRLFGPGFRNDGDLLRLAVLSVVAAPVVHVGAGLAAGLGAFRAYVAASVAYAVAALGLAAILVPAFGLRGAAVAVTAGAAVRQLAMLVVLRWRLGFPWPGRIVSSWGCSVAAAAVSFAWRPGRLGAAAAAVALIGLFFVWGRVTLDELTALRSKAFRGA